MQSAVAPGSYLVTISSTSLGFFGPNACLHAGELFSLIVVSSKWFANGTFRALVLKFRWSLQLSLSPWLGKRKKFSSTFPPVPSHTVGLLGYFRPQACGCSGRNLALFVHHNTLMMVHLVTFPASATPRARVPVYFSLSVLHFAGELRALSVTFPVVQ